MNLQTALILAPPILFALAFHEFSHGFIALKFGDPTAKYAGRLTLNPLAHLDPIGTLMVFLVHFGWAKPVPVDARYLKDPRRDMLWIALAGPLSNMLLALVSGLLIRAVGPQNLMMHSSYSTASILSIMLVYSLQINLALAFFNLLPLPPLDGGRILAGLLPRKYDNILYTLEKSGPFILMAIIVMGMLTGFHLFGMVINPFVSFFSNIFAGI